MDVGAIDGVELDDGVDDGLRLLRGGGVVEIDQRLAVDGLLEDREIFAEFVYVEGVCRDRRSLGLRRGDKTRPHEWGRCTQSARHGTG